MRLLPTTDRRRHLALRRHWRTLATFAAVVVALVLVGGAVRVTPVVTAGGSLPPRQPINDTTNDIDLFDPGIVHRISVTVDPADRQRMLDAYQQDGDKVVVPAEVEIDGVEVPGAGIRFKGNSSLAGLGGPGGFEGDGGEIDWEAFDEALTRCLDSRGVEVDIGPGPPDEGGSGDGGFEDGGFPQTLFDGTGDEFAAPYLLVFDHGDPSGRYQGLRALALRTDGNGTILAEPVSLAAYERVGLPGPRTVMAGLSLNGGDERLYGVTEILDQGYVDRHLRGADGALFKVTARQSQDFSYRGPDHTRYQGFALVAGQKRFDHAPLIDLIRFADEASDEEFKAGLAERIDVDELALLLAVNNVLVNTDSIGTGPGGNYYLFYDAETDRFRALGWDFNFSLGGLDGFNPETSTNPLDSAWDTGGPIDADVATDGPILEGGDLGGGQPSSDGEDPFAACEAEVSEELDVDLGFPDEPFVDGDGPADDGAPDNETFDDENFDDEGGGFGTNRLVERFLAEPTFLALYREASETARAELLDSGFVAGELTRLTGLVDTAVAERGLAPKDRLDTQNRALATFIAGRTRFLQDQGAD